MMSSTLFVLIFGYLSAIVFSAVIMTVLFVRSSRSAVYFGLIYSNLAILASLIIRLFEMLSPNIAIRLIFIHANLVLSAIILAFLFQLIYSLVTRHRPPVMMHMIEGAAVLVLYVVSLTWLPIITSGYRFEEFQLLYAVYLVLPILFDLVFAGLVFYAVRHHQINLTFLSFSRIMTVLPDTVYVFDKDGTIIDTNVQIRELSACSNGDELCQAFAALDGADCSDLIEKIEHPGTRAMGEFIWIRPDGSEQTWVWSSQAVRNQRGSWVGSYLLLSDRTHPRRVSTRLQRQNDELRQINQQLSDYSQLVGQYAEATTRHEVAMIIDSSIRQRLTAAFEQLEHARTANAADQNVRTANGADQNARLQILISDCRQALADIRALVSRLAE